MSRSATSTPSPNASSRDRSMPSSPTRLSQGRKRFSLPTVAVSEPSSPPSPSSSVSSSLLSASAAPFAPNAAVRASQTGAAEDYLDHLSKEAEARYAAGKAKGAAEKGTTATVVQVSDLHWFTTDAHLIEAAAAAGLSLTFKDITFLEHKCNGKSKGIAFINCHTTTHMMRLIKWFEHNKFQGKRVSISISTNSNGKPPLPPPTHDKDNGGLSFRPASDELPTRSPLPFLPTNSHGGVNFNRVPLHHRQQMQQMQQAGFLSGGYNGRGRNAATTYAATAQANATYVEPAHKNVILQPNPFYVPDWQEQYAPTHARPMRV